LARARFQTASDLGNVISTFTLGEAPITELSVDHESEATYSLEALGAIVKNTPSISETLKIEYSTNLPLKLDLLLTHGRFHFYLAPMIE
jgi:hypothetical protein